MKFTTLFSIAITTASIATPASAGILSPGLVSQVLSSVIGHVPLIMDGISIVSKFPTCAQSCLVSEPANCAICDFGCRCRDHEHIERLAECMQTKCPNEKDQDAVHGAWESSCRPYIVE